MYFTEGIPIPVIVTLLQLNRILHSHRYLYSPSLKLKLNSKEMEIDFAILNTDFENQLEFGIAECKNNIEIDEKDIINMKSIANEMRELPIDCYLIFSKFSKSFTEKEMDLFKTLVRDNYKIILMANKELEPYEPYMRTDERLKHAFTLSDMYQNSLHLYLN